MLLPSNLAPSSVNFLKVSERSGLESHFWVTVLGVKCGFHCSVWARSSHVSERTHGWGPGFLSPGQAGRQAGMEHPEPHRMSSLVPQHPGWSLTGWLEPRAQEVKREGREHMTVVVGRLTLLSDPWQFENSKSQKRCPHRATFSALKAALI